MDGMAVFYTIQPYETPCDFTDYAFPNAFGPNLLSYMGNILSLQPHETRHNTIAIEFSRNSSLS